MVLYLLRGVAASPVSTGPPFLHACLQNSALAWRTPTPHAYYMRRSRSDERRAIAAMQGVEHEQIHVPLKHSFITCSARQGIQFLQNSIHIFEVITLRS